MMFFRKKKETESGKLDYSLLSADMHSHLLPGIDDGSPDIETSVELIKGMKALGFKKLITTPHIFWEIYPNTREIVLGKLEEVRARLVEEQVSVELEAAAEYYLDEHLVEMVKNREPLLTFGNKMVLVEFSMVSQPFEVKNIFFEMQLQGYQPVLAHPERYTYLEYNKGFYDELKDAGYLFQMNALSLGGYYGSAVLNLARYLIKKDYYDLIGTDLHHPIHLQALAHPPHAAALQRVFESGRFLNSQL